MSIAKGLTIYGNGVNLACAFQSFSPETTTEVLDSTTLCDTAKTYAQGFREGKASASGVWNADQTNGDEIHNILSNAFANSADVILTAGMESASIGVNAVLINGKVLKYGVEMPLGQLIMASADFQADNGVNFGKLLYTTTVASGTTNGTSDDKTTSSANGGMAHAHVILGTATSVSVKIQHSSNNSTWVDLVDLGSFASAFGAASGLSTAGTTVNRYLRAQIVSDGSATVFAAFARR